MLRRQHTIRMLNDLASPLHEQLTGGQEDLSVHYRLSIDKGAPEFADSHEAAQAFAGALKATHQRELERGITLTGPHRDDLGFTVNGADMGIYGSRGQQRTTALSLKLAEARFMLSQTGEPPVLLLDDVLSELDAERRHHLLKAVLEYQQVMITATDLDRFPSEFLNRAEKFKVIAGTVKPC